MPPTTCKVSNPPAHDKGDDDDDQSPGPDKSTTERRLLEYVKTLSVMPSTTPPTPPTQPSEDPKKSL